MPRVLTRQELESRQARFTDGSPVKKLELAKLPVKEAPLVAAPTIDAKPIAEVVDRFADAMKQAVSSQLAAIESMKPVESAKSPTEWEFRVVRDSKGRVEKIIAKAIS